MVRGGGGGVPVTIAVVPRGTFGQVTSRKLRATSMPMKHFAKVGMKLAVELWHDTCVAVFRLGVDGRLSGIRYRAPPPPVPASDIDTLRIEHRLCHFT